MNIARGEKAPAQKTKEEKMHYTVEAFRKYRKELGRRMKERRQQCGLSLEACAEYSGVSLLRIYDFERGKHNPSLEELLRIACSLNLPLSKLC